MTRPVEAPIDALSEAEAAEALTHLADEIAAHDIRYYQDEAPSLSDADYDALYQELEAIEAAHPELAVADSPTKRVIGAVLDGFVPVRHVVPMLSIRTETDTTAGGAQAFDARYGIPLDHVYAHNWIDYKDARYCEGCWLATLARTWGE